MLATEGLGGMASPVPVGVAELEGLGPEGLGPGLEGLGLEGPELEAAGPEDKPAATAGPGLGARGGRAPLAMMASQGARGSETRGSPRSLR